MSPELASIDLTWLGKIDLDFMTILFLPGGSMQAKRFDWVI